MSTPVYLYALIGLEESDDDNSTQWRNQVGAEGAERPPGQQFWGNF